MHYTVGEISKLLGTAVAANTEAVISYLSVDSRKIVFPIQTLFFALRTANNNGHKYIPNAYAQGVRAFVVDNNFIVNNLYKDAHYIRVSNVLLALQQLAAHHRNQFSYPVIGITGSNGKTIVKEWLFQLLSPTENVVRSPRSYNSQIGVPLSLWQMESSHSIAIIEAGISMPKEMLALQRMIMPSIGILTNIGDAHSELFENEVQKIEEKLLLFSKAKQVIIPLDSVEKYNCPFSRIAALLPNSALFTWSKCNTSANVFVKSITIYNTESVIEIVFKQQSFSYNIPFADEASINNSITCCTALLAIGNSFSLVIEKMPLLTAIDMRLQLQKATNNCFIINDSYSNDYASLLIGLDYLQQQASGNHTTLILSDIVASKEPPAVLYGQIATVIKAKKVNVFIGIGANIMAQKHLFETVLTSCFFYQHTQHFINTYQRSNSKDSYILLKGARVFEFEKIAQWFSLKTHQTLLEINLNALVHNLNVYKNLVKPGVLIMAMVKAFGYGSGGAEVAKILQYHQIDYLAVAYADEGVELRKAGIHSKILVLNIDEAAFENLIQYQLEPEIFSFDILNAFLAFLQRNGLLHFPIHIKIDTGMHRLGFLPKEIESLANQLTNNPNLFVQSAFTHLAASDDNNEDAFTNFQHNEFVTSCNKLKKQLGYQFLMHVSNTAAIAAKPYLQHQMVRLGIGLYGVNTGQNNSLPLHTVATLKTTVAQIKQVEAGKTVGYNRKGKVLVNSLIATIRIGYADGYSRALSNGVGKVFINGHSAPIIGNICMDMTMVDITNIPNVQVGSTVVELFGENIPVTEVAKNCNTIPYEILTTINQRVPRIYLQE